VKKWEKLERMEGIKVETNKCVTGITPLNLGNKPSNKFGKKLKGIIFLKGTLRT